MKNDSSPSDPASEHRRLLAEAIALNRRGQVRQAELDALEARIQKAVEEDEQRLAESLAEIERNSAVVAFPPSRRWQLLAALLLVYPLAGLLFEITVGYSFVFAFADRYSAIAHWIFFGALVVLIGLFLPASARRRLREQHPNWLRRWLGVPLLSGFWAVLFVFATPGWAALLGWISGGPISTLDAQIVSVSSVSKNSKGGCRQTAKLLANDVFATLCLDGRSPTPVLVASDQVLLIGRSSWFGLLVHEIRRR